MVVGRTLRLLLPTMSEVILVSPTLAAVNERMVEVRLRLVSFGAVAGDVGLPVTAGVLAAGGGGTVPAQTERGNVICPTIKIIMAILLNQLTTDTPSSLWKEVTTQRLQHKTAGTMAYANRVSPPNLITAPSRLLNPLYTLSGSSLNINCLCCASCGLISQSCGTDTVLSCQPGINDYRTTSFKVEAHPKSSSSNDSL